MVILRDYDTVSLQLCLYTNEKSGFSFWGHVFGVFGVSFWGQVYFFSAFTFSQTITGTLLICQFNCPLPKLCKRVGNATITAWKITKINSTFQAYHLFISHFKG